MLYYCPTTGSHLFWANNSQHLTYWADKGRGRKRPHLRRAMLFGESAIADGRAAGVAGGGGKAPFLADN